MARSFKVLAIKKQGYPATFSFGDEATGTTGTDIDFVDGDNSDADCDIEIISNSNGHKKVMRLYDNNAGGRCYMSNTLASSPTTGIGEFWIKTSDATLFNGWYFYGAGGRATYMTIYQDKFQYLDGGWNDVGLAATDDTWYHIKIIFDCATDTYEIWIDNVQYKAAAGFENNQTSITHFFILTLDGHSGYYMYFDAIGYSWDASYNIGDNCFWRHYKETSDSFEDDDVGDMGSSQISWVDWVDTAGSFEIVPEFNEHKKVLRFYYSSAAGGYDQVYHSCDSQSKDGWFECWIKTSDYTGDDQRILLYEWGRGIIVNFAFRSSQFQIYTGGAWRQVTGSPTPANDTWYHVFIQWYDGATDTFDLWIDNVQYEDGTNCVMNMTAGVDRIYLVSFQAGIYTYVDAPSCSLDGDEKADNRTFDYNSTYTSEDITTEVENVLTENKLGKWIIGTLNSETSYENSEIFFQVYDVNDKLGLEADIKNRTQLPEGVYVYDLRDKNQDDLENRSSNAFSAAKIHDPTDSTSMLKVILPNVGEADGDLLLVDADTKATTYSPTTQNYPDFMMLRDLGDLGDVILIIHPDGKCYFDDDKASGTSLDFDTAADKDKMCNVIYVKDILETINYFEIFGAINPDTGKRFYKIIDNIGEDKKRPWRYTNNSFLTQTDVDNYAAALESRTATIKIIKIEAQSLGSHNMGETFDYKYVDSVYNVPQANYYIIYESIDYDKNKNIIILSEGMIEESKYAAEYERDTAYNDSYAAEIYDTDITALSLAIYPYAGAARGQYGSVHLNNNGEIAAASFYISDKIDTSRAITLYFIVKINALFTDSKVNVQYYINRMPADCSSGSQGVINDTEDLDCASLTVVSDTKKTIAAADVYADNWYRIEYFLSDNNPADIEVMNITLEYYQKRSL